MNMTAVHKPYDLAMDVQASLMNSGPLTTNTPTIVTAPLIQHRNSAPPDLSPTLQPNLKVIVDNQKPFADALTAIRVSGDCSSLKLPLSVPEVVSPSTNSLSTAQNIGKYRRWKRTKFKFW